MNLRHVFDVDRRAVHGLDGQIVQIVQQYRAAVHPNLILGLGKFCRTRRQYQVLQVQGIRDIDRRKLLRVQFLRFRSTITARCFPPNG